VSDRDAALALLAKDGLIAQRDDRWRTTARWQAAMMRAALRLLARNDGGGDLRVPVVTALCELFGDELSDEEIAALATAMLPIEQHELRPR